jgi:hypothetical protein
MLLWAKAAQRRAKQEGREMTEEAAAAMGGGGLRPEQLDQVRAVFGGALPQLESTMMGLGVKTLG